MKIKSMSVKLLFHSSKVREIERPNMDQQEAILKHINAAMEEWNANIIDIEVSASKEKEND